MCLVNAHRLKNKLLKRIVYHLFYVTFACVYAPGMFYFHISTVLPNFLEPWSLTYCIHMFCSYFLFLNVVSNMIYGMFTDTSIKGRFLDSVDKNNWTLCTTCECLCPPRSWHCNICDICILKRDHHCSFLACCIGYFNLRYFMFLNLYSFFSNSYTLYFNIRFISQFLAWNNGVIIFKFIFPLVSIVLDFGYETFSVLLIVQNFIMVAFSGFMLFFHLNNILKGRVCPEIKRSTIYNMGWKSNLIEVFGSRWYLTWISAFIHSPLPGNGIEWAVVDKSK